MQPRPLSATSKEDSSSNLLTLSSSLHTLSLASLRELLLGCALENEQVAAHINERLHSQDGMKSPNLDNFRFHNKSSGGDGENTVPSSPDTDNGNSPISSNNSSSDSITPPNGEINYGNYGSSNVLKKSGEINYSTRSLMPSWNWSYYYYKESSSGATAKRDDVDEGIYLLHISYSSAVNFLKLVDFSFFFSFLTTNIFI